MKSISGNFQKNTIKSQKTENNLSKKNQIDIWSDHFESLAKTQKIRNTTRIAELEPKLRNVDYYMECDMVPTWNELTTALKHTPIRKSAGIDKIPSEVWKLVQSENAPESPLARLIYEMVQKAWKGGSISAVNNTSIVIPIPKKGDLSNPNNYRGISLIPTLLKLISKIIAIKLSEMDCKHGILVKEQAGFRNREECVAQATSLYEIVKRRKLESKSTFVAFIDFEKAYDKVPHDLLALKLKQNKIGGKLLKVIQNLYMNPYMAVRYGSETSKSFKYGCGVRQGCPMSPILFDIYINDIFKRMKGVTVPGISKTIPGLLFADDAEMKSNLNY
ncbi:LINE-1 reverse transcriptase-like protein [Smittium culicis]|uniref:LINE-1 reverse transcriptase-like protein n=1 Tax=Smittium culicis TaxID=133412 RepID=A0A1R1X153_9FUNG|nr:LINE-1 reverse transcriptase-like protein [Smittium culicis]